LQRGDAFIGPNRLRPRAGTLNIVARLHRERRRTIDRAGRTA